MKNENPWSREGNTLLYNNADVGMIGFCSKSNKMKVDMISYEHTYDENDIRHLGDYMWFIGVNRRVGE